MRLTLFAAAISFLALAAQAQDIITTVPLPPGAVQSLTFSQSTRVLYLSTPTSVLVLKDHGEEISRLPARDPTSVVLVPALRLGYIVNGGAPELTTFDPGRGIALAHLAIPLDTIAQAVFDPRTTEIFVLGAAGSHNRLAIIDAVGGQVLKTLDLDEKPSHLLADGSGQIFMTMPASDEIGVLDTRRQEVVKHWPVGNACQQPGPAALDEIHHRLYFACGNGQLVAMDSDYGQVETSLPASTTLNELVYDPSHDRLYAADAGGSVLVVGATQGTGKDSKLAILTALPTAAETRFLALDGRDQHLYLVSKAGADNTLLIVPTEPVAAAGDTP